MARTVAIGLQDFGDLIQKNYFYVDKTAFIKEWWESGDSVTLITRPRRFGKTLNRIMQVENNGFRGFLSGMIRNIGNFREPILLSVCHLPE